MGLESVDITDIDIAVGDSVVVTTGAFADNVGTVKEINLAKKTVTVAISLFGRETPMELDFTQVQALVK